MAVNAFSNPQFSVDATGSMKPSLSGANALTPTAAVQAKTKTAPQILRYPLKYLEGSADYLLIKVVEYKEPGFNRVGANNISLQTGTQALQRNIENPLYYINLPMPSDIDDKNSVNWGDDEMNAVTAGLVGASNKILGSNNYFKAAADAIQSAAKDAKTLSTAGAQDIVQAYFASKAVNVTGANTTPEGLLSRATGQVLNPNLELLFTGVNLRNFAFTFEFAPRDPDESKMVKDIIRTFKKSMAPKTTVGGQGGQAIGAGLFISAPNVFQLTFKTGKDDHPFLYKMKPCALTNMGVNYTASGTYATYADATPVHMRMTLEFSEINPIYAEDYEGVGGVGY